MSTHGTRLHTLDSLEQLMCPHAARPKSPQDIGSMSRIAAEPYLLIGPLRIVHKESVCFAWTTRSVDSGSYPKYYATQAGRPLIEVHRWL